MKYRPFGRSGKAVSEVGFGAWAIGGTWGEVSEEDARAALHASLDAGVTFIDTADVYGDGRSERIIADVLAERDGPRPFVATKAGRRVNPHVIEGYTKEALTSFVDRSRDYLRMDCLDLVQLHCPPPEAYYRPDVFDVMEGLVSDGKIQGYGVSVEKVEEALKAIEYPGVQSIQIIYNIFRQRPNELFFREARARNVAVIVRVPLASGLLTGKMTAATHFDAEDHRAFNRNGEAFDKGETFSGVPYDLALELVEEVRKQVPADVSMVQFALKWILMEEAVTVVIPGAKTDAQARANASASDIAPLSAEVMEAMRGLYQSRIAAHVHHFW